MRLKPVYYSSRHRLRLKRYKRRQWLANQSEIYLLSLALAVIGLVLAATN